MRLLAVLLTIAYIAILMTILVQVPLGVWAGVVILLLIIGMINDETRDY